MANFIPSVPTLEQLKLVMPRSNAQFHEWNSIEGKPFWLTDAVGSTKIAEEIAMRLLRAVSPDVEVSNLKFLYAKWREQHGPYRPPLQPLKTAHGHRELVDATQQWAIRFVFHGPIDKQLRDVWYIFDKVTFDALGAFVSGWVVNGRWWFHLEGDKAYCAEPRRLLFACIECGPPLRVPAPLRDDYRRAMEWAQIQANTPTPTRKVVVHEDLEQLKNAMLKLTSENKRKQLEQITDEAPQPKKMSAEELAKLLKPVPKDDEETPAQKRRSLAREHGGAERDKPNDANRKKGGGVSGGSSDSRRVIGRQTLDDLLRDSSS